jgi:hypothetical protein
MGLFFPFYLNKMNSLLLIIVFFLFCVDARIFVMRSRRRREERIQSKLDNRKKCQYVNFMFSFTNNTCSVKPAYFNSQALELWDFQQKNCVHNIIVFSRLEKFIIQVFLFCLCVIIWSYAIIYVDDRFILS